MSIKVHHHTYVVPSLVDGAVAMAQAERRRDKRGETTVVHAHADEKICNNDCKIVAPGFYTRSVATEAVPVQEEVY